MFRRHVLTEAVWGQTLTSHDCRRSKLELLLYFFHAFFKDKIWIGLEQIQTDSIVLIRQTHFFAFYQQWNTSLQLLLRAECLEDFGVGSFSQSLGFMSGNLQSITSPFFLVIICFFVISEKSFSVAKKHLNVHRNQNYNRLNLLFLFLTGMYNSY